MDVVVSHISLNSAGGGETVCLAIIKALRNSGNRVTLATVDKTDWLRLHKILGEITLPDNEFYTVSRLPKTSFNLLNSALLVVFYWVELILIRITKKHRLIINTCGEKVNSIADIAYFNGIAFRCAFLLAGTGAMRRCLGVLYHHFSKIFDKINNSLILTNSSFHKNVIEKCIKKKASVVYPPVRLQKFRGLGDKKRIQNIVLTYSQYVPTQNLEYLPRIAEIAKQAQFIIISPSESASKSTLNELSRAKNGLLVSDRITLLTNQPFSKYVELLSIAKVFLRTLQNEPFGISIVEAMAAGCVPVVPMNGGPWCDILDQTQGRYGYGYRNFEDAGIKISTLMKDESLRMEVAERARERAKVFEATAFEEKILAVVEGTCKRKSPRDKVHSPPTVRNV